MFGHRQFLSSFWILEITRFTVSSILSSLGLLVRGSFFIPHKDLRSGSRWSFFIGSSPVQQSLQEYLGVLVGYPVRWISGNILKGSPDGVGLKYGVGLKWCLEVVISGHTEPVTGNSMSILSPVTSATYPIRETIQTKCYHAYGHQVGWAILYPLLLTPPGFPNPCEVFLYLNCGHDMKPIE